MICPKLLPQVHARVSRCCKQTRDEKRQSIYSSPPRRESDEYTGGVERCAPLPLSSLPRLLLRGPPRLPSTVQAPSPQKPSAAVLGVSSTRGIRIRLPPHFILSGRQAPCLDGRRRGAQWRHLSRHWRVVCPLTPAPAALRAKLRTPGARIAMFLSSLCVQCESLNNFLAGIEAACGRIV